MELHRFQEADSFYERAKPYLLAHEAEHNLMLGICRTLTHASQPYEDPPYLAIAEAHGKIAAIAIRTSPYPLVISKVQDAEAFRPLVQDILAYEESLPGVSGLVAEATAFAQTWQTLTGKPYHLKEQLYIYQLDQVQAIASPSCGHLRLATEGDRALLKQWLQAFEQEIWGTTQSNSDRFIDTHLSQNSLFFWQDQVPVCLVAGHGIAPDGGRIGPVYTPPEYRRRGYAMTCVATISQQLLDQGCRCCFLFTQSGNPTSNRIYQKIGYRQLSDWYEYRFQL